MAGSLTNPSGSGTGSTLLQLSNGGTQPVTIESITVSFTVTGSANKLSLTSLYYNGQMIWNGSQQEATVLFNTFLPTVSLEVPNDNIPVPLYVVFTGEGNNPPNWRVNYVTVNYGGACSISSY
jgi:hypothetical protein